MGGMEILALRDMVAAGVVAHLQSAQTELLRQVGTVVAALRLLSLELQLLMRVVVGVAR